MLDENLIYGTVQASGTVRDIGGIVGYINQKRRTAVGVEFSHIPYGYASYFGYYDTLRIDGILYNVYKLDQLIQRQFNEQVSLLASYPFSRVLRTEASVGFNYVWYYNEIVTQTYSGNFIIDEQRVKLDAPPALKFATGTLALAGDDSKFVFTSPLDGYRYRMEAGVYAGSFDFMTMLADFRYYERVKPVTFAARALHYGRYFGDSDTSLLTPLVLGSDYFIRGYNIYTIDPSECSTGDCYEITRLLGSKIGTLNFEVRFPLTGPREIAPIKSLALPITLNAFFDAGIAWDKLNKPVLEISNDPSKRVPLFSAGLSARMNILGYLVGEVFWAYPFQRPAKTNGVFGVMLYPGW
jgi:hypothetical protein